MSGAKKTPASHSLINTSRTGPAVLSATFVASRAHRIVTATRSTTLAVLDVGLLSPRDAQIKSHFRQRRCVGARLAEDHPFASCTEVGSQSSGGGTAR